MISNYKQINIFLLYFHIEEPSGTPVEEVVVQSNLNVRKKPPQPVRQKRAAVYIYPINDLILTAHLR